MSYPAERAKRLRAQQAANARAAQTQQVIRIPQMAQQQQMVQQQMIQPQSVQYQQATAQPVYQQRVQYVPAQQVMYQAAPQVAYRSAQTPVAVSVQQPMYVNVRQVHQQPATRFNQMQAQKRQSGGGLRKLIPVDVQPAIQSHQNQANPQQRQSNPQHPPFVPHSSQNANGNSDPSMNGHRVQYHGQRQAMHSQQVEESKEESMMAEASAPPEPEYLYPNLKDAANNSR